MSDAPEPLVLYECRDRVATITFNRPSRLNAFNDDLTRELLAAMHRFDLDPEADVAVLTGAGRAFSSGADVQQRQLRPREEMERHGGPQARDANSENLLIDCVNWKPVICAVHGYVLGLALGIALESDLIVAEEGTKFQVTETPRGLSGAKYWALLNFRGGGSLAVQVSLTGRFFTAEEALRVNIIDHVAPKGEYLAVARELARRGEADRGTAAAARVDARGDRRGRGRRGFGGGFGRQHRGAADTGKNRDQEPAGDRSAGDGGNRAVGAR